MSYQPAPSGRFFVERALLICDLHSQPAKLMPAAILRGPNEADFQKGNVLHYSGNCPYTCALLCFYHEVYSRPAPKWRIGFGDSMPWYRSLRGFLGALLNALGCLFFGGCAWETLGSAGFTMARFANPRTATTLLFGDD